MAIKEKIEAGPIGQNLEEISDMILNLDKKIRFVEIVVNDKKILKIRQGVENYLTSEETENSILDSLKRWETRRKLSHKLGEPVFAMAEYKKVKRLTFPIHSDGIILVTLDPEGFHEIIIKEIIEIIEMVNWKV